MDLKNCLSDKKQAEVALRGIRAHYQDLYEKTPIMLHSVDAQGYLVNVSDYWLEKLGYTRQEVIGRKLTDFLTTQSQQYAPKGMLPEHSTNGVCRDIPCQVASKTGKIIDVLLCVSTERDEEGRAERSFAAMVDMTERNRALAELKASEMRLQTLMNNSPNLTFVKEADTGQLIYTNQTFTTFFQVEADDLLGKTDFDWLPLEIAQENRQNDLEAVEAGKVIQLTEFVPDAQGLPQEWMVVKFPFRDVDHTMLIGGIAINVTEQKRLERKLHEERELAQVTLHSIGDAVITTDAAGMVTYLNPVAEEFTGWAQSKAQGLPLSEVFIILNEHTRELVESPVTRMLREGKTVGTANHTILVAKDGTERGIDDLAAPIRDREGTLIGTVLIFHDVTRIRQLARQLTWQAEHDDLTGLVNRRRFEQELEDVLRPRQKSGVLCYLDLDRFKLINDSCGHLAGDHLLQQIANILNQQVRESDTVARLGGDEFAILLRECSLTVAHRITRLMCQRVQSLRFVWEGQTFSVGASIGIVAITSDSHSVTEVMAAADAACYAAKAAGRNQVHIYSADDLSLSHQRNQQRWCLRIDQAIAENRFRLYHQKIATVDAALDTSQHTEILLRLLDEQGQIIAPMAFIPAAERYHRMPLIDGWVIRQCLAALSTAEAKLTQTNAQRLYNINLSGASLSNEKFLADLQLMLQQGIVDPKTICFEITESAAASNLYSVTIFINTLKRLGCRFALDDFGSGIASFEYLRQLPVDYIKIDGSFVQNLSDPLNAAIVSSICNIGQAMHLEIIAESVEDNATRNQLKALGVNYVQGFGIARPVPFSLAA